MYIYKQRRWKSAECDVIYEFRKCRKFLKLTDTTRMY